MPFATGTIALGLHASSGSASLVVDTLRRQAVEASESGFDGVTLSEHHGGFPQYIPSPTMLTSVLLAAMRTGWAGPCPSVLPLRDVVTQVEDLAWLAAAYQGRVGAGFVPGYHERDFEIVGRDFAGRMSAFRDSLARASDLLQGAATDPLVDDVAIAALGISPVPVICGVGGPKGAAFAAECRVGVLLTSLLDSAKARRISESFRESGGTKSCVLIRQAWVGTPSDSSLNQLARYRSAASDSRFLETDDQDIVTHGEPEEIAERLAQQVLDSGADSLNLRIFSDEASASELVEQVGIFGRQVLPDVRRRLHWPPLN
jgi:alkanesulfonate monooxygenase SsuD/methylene tetrahydromethanopterin reductase-like flavin-dependent oxidoreductase (luciferase family)